MPRTQLKIFRRFILEKVKDFHLKKLIRGKAVLILGGGPSAAELETIPENVLFMTCNRCPKILLQKNINRRIDLYTSSRFNVREEYLDETKQILSRLGADVFLFDDSGLAKKQFRGTYKKYIELNHTDNRCLNSLISPLVPADIQGKSSKRWTSTGVLLLQMALFYKAAEIYLAGMDLDAKPYAFGGKSMHYEGWHQDIDHAFIQIASKKFSHVYSAAAKSPIIRYFRYKPLPFNH